jgi:hypothetical protein
MTAALPCVLPTQCLEYLRAYRHAFALGDTDFQLYALREQGRLVAVVPARLDTRQVFGAKLRVLTFMDLPMPVRDVLVLPEIELAAVIGALSEYLRQTWPWLYLHFRAVPSTSRLVSESPRPGLMLLSEPCGASNAIDVSAGDHIGHVLTRNMRSNIKRKRKRLANLGRVEFVTVTEPAELDAAYQGFLDTEAAGWKSLRGGRRAVKLHADQTLFYRTLMTLKSSAREAHIHLLLLDGTPIASDYCIVSKGTCYSLKHGYDERYADTTPGNLLRAYTIEHYQSDPSIHTLDLVSAWGWHERWRPEARPIYDIKIFNRSPSARLLHTMVSAKRSLQTRRQSRGVQVETG